MAPIQRCVLNVPVVGPRNKYFFSTLQQLSDILFLLRSEFTHVQVPNSLNSIEFGTNTPRGRAPPA
jgi:hypothetical protein